MREMVVGPVRFRCRVTGAITETDHRDKFRGAFVPDVNVGAPGRADWGWYPPFQPQPPPSMNEVLYESSRMDMDTFHFVHPVMGRLCLKSGA